MTKFIKKNKIRKIITVDAGLKLEGEKTGTVAEGVGVAMGGIGVARFAIEEIATKKEIPLDAVVVKVSEEGALMPMKKEIFDAVDKSIEKVKESLKRSKKNEKVLIIGVGNTCGVGNDRSTVKQVDKMVKKNSRKKEDKKNKFLKF